MRVRALLLATLLALVLGALAVPSAQAAAGSISGHYAPYEYVTLQPLAPAPSLVIITDEHGDFVFEDVDPGSYVVCAGDLYNLGSNTGVHGYTQPRDCYDGARYAGSATPIVVASGQHRAGIDIEPQPWGLVDGEVTDADGGVPDAILYVTAYVWSERDQEWQEAHRTSAGSGLNSDFSLTLATGVPFRVCTSALGAQSPPACFGDLEVTGADDFTAGDAIAGDPSVDLGTLTLPAPAEITGTVRDGAGNPLEDIVASAHRRDAQGVWRRLPHITSDPNFTGADGVFRVPYLAPGTYRVCFFENGEVEWNSRCWGSDSYPPDEDDHVAEADDIVVTEGQLVEGIDVTLTPYVFIYNEVAPRVTGTPRVGAALTIDDGVWNPAAVTVTHEWRVDGQTVATGSAFTPLTTHLGKELRVRSTGSAPGDDPVTVTTLPGYIAPGRFALPTPPVVSGKAKVGRTLKVTKGTWSPTPASVKPMWCVGAVCYSGTSLKLKESWRGKKVYATVEVSSPGYTTRKWTSPKLTVR